jgi:hypothetical protein
MKEFYQRKLEEASNQKKPGTVDQSVVDEFEKQKANWNQERQFLQEQVAFTQRQIEENKVMHEALLAAINQRSSM